MSLLEGNIWLTLIFIMMAQIVYVTMVTVRWLILVRGARYAAAAMSFFEVLLYIYTLALVVGHLNDLSHLVVYAGGYSIGCVVGSWLETKIRFGTATLQVVVPRGSILSHALREKGMAVTAWDARGRDAEREVLLIVVRRRNLGKLHRLIDELEPQSLTLDIEPRNVRRGFMARRLV